jgi:hypothetical protein
LGSSLSATVNLQGIVCAIVETFPCHGVNRMVKSLSQIARLITGTRWSGLFFGIKNEQSGGKSKEA